MHRTSVNEKMIESNIRIIGPDARNGLSPELRSLQHISFIHGCQFFAAAAGRLKGDMSYAFYLGDGIPHRIKCLVSVIAKPAGFAEIEAAEQFADNEQIGSLKYFRAQRRRADESRNCRRRTEISKSTQRFSELQQADLRAMLRQQRTAPFADCHKARA